MTQRKWCELGSLWFLSSFALGSSLFSSGCSIEREEVERTSLAQTSSWATTQISMEVSLPTGVSLNAFALGASERLTLADGVRVTSETGPFRLFSTGGETTELGADVSVGDASAAGTLVSRGSVRLRERAHVFGDVLTEGAFETQNLWTVDGAVDDNTSLTLRAPLDWSVTFQSGGPNVSLEPDQTSHLTPGAFGSIHVKSRSKLRLASGSYSLSSLTFDPHSELILDEASGPVILYVSGSVTWRGEVVGENASERLLLAGVGASPLELDAPFRGSVFAPAASLRLGPVDGSGHEGSFYAKTLEALARNPIRFVPFAHWGYLFPPKISVECRNRAKASHAAALFTVDNPLDFPVMIPVGPDNFVTASPAKNEPLYVFAPGRQENFYWLEYGGPEVSWTLRGNRVDVPDATRPCRLDEWELVESPLRTVASGAEALALEQRCTPEDGCAPPVHYLDFEATWGGPLTSLPPPTRQLTFNAHTWNVIRRGTGTVFGERGYIWIEAFDHLPTSEELAHVGDPTNFLEHDELSSLALHARPVTSTGGALFVAIVMVESTVDLIKIYENTKLAVIYRYEPASGEYSPAALYDYDGSRSTSEIGGDCEPMHPKNVCGCAIDRSSDWEMCWRMGPPTGEPPRICAVWNTQYVDGGFGEDDYLSSDIFEEPASYAFARLYSKTGSFTSWPSPHPLDADGCVPLRMTPDVPAAEIGFELFGSVFHEPSGTKIQIRENSAPASSFRLEMEVTDDPPSTGRPTRKARSRMLDELTRSGAIASQAARLQTSGRDMGLAGNEIEIEARSYEILHRRDLGPCGSAAALGNVLQLRPSRAPTTVDDPATPIDERECAGASDAAFKDIWSHEFGHAMQSAFPARIRNVAVYDFRVTRSDGSIFVGDGPMIPEECRCSQVQAGFSTLHCIQSLELTGPAQSEGYASAYGKLFYNNPAEADCATAYVKWTLWPECLPGNDCISINGLSDAEYEQIRVDNGLQGLPDRARLDDDQDWFLIRPPFIFSCAAAQKWRNTACLTPTVADPVLLDQFGNEMDWEQFFWALWAPGIDAGDGIGGGGAWTPSLVNIGYQTMGAVDPNWSTWRTTNTAMLITGRIDLDNQTRFLQLGRSRGVDDAPLQ